MRRLLIVLTLFSFSLFVKASDFRALTTLQGLSQNDINCIFQDSRGFIWIGTNDGLNRYDGYNFKIFRKQPRQENGLVSNIIQSITEDTEGNLWIGTNDNGVSKLDVHNYVFSTYSNTSESPDILLSNHILDILADSHSNVWIVTPEGVNVINTINNEIHAIEIDDILHKNKTNFSNYIRSVFEDNKGNIWLGTLYGIRQLNYKTYKVERTYSKEKANKSVYGFLRWHNKILMFNPTSILEFDDVSKQFKTILEFNGIIDIAIDNSDNFWIATKEGVYVVSINNKVINGFQIIESFGNSLQYNTLTSSQIKDIMVDETGMVWIGTNGGGINFCNPQKKKFNLYSKNITEEHTPYNSIRCICEDKYGGLWFGTDGGGMSYLGSNQPLDSESFKTKVSGKILGASKVYSLFEDRDNDRLWCGIGAGKGLMLFDTKSGKAINTDNMNVDVDGSVFSVIVDKEKALWVGTYSSGLWRLIPDGKSKYTKQHFVASDESYALPSNIIRSLKEDSKGNVWIGTSNGLVKIRARDKYKKNPKFFTFQNIPNDSTSISYDYILPIFESSSGDIWIGTMGGGLNLYQETKDGVGYFKSYSTREDLPNNVIKGILEDDNKNLWISSNRGLTRFNPQTLKIDNFVVEDGLQDYEFAELSCFKRSNGEMLFGGVNGFNSFNPYQIHEDTTKGKVVFTKLEVLNQPIKPGKKYRNRIVLDMDINSVDRFDLKYDENSFTLFFAGLHYAAPHKNQYRYKLEGFEKDWVYTNSNARFAKYTNLKPGDYTLLVQTSNSDGVWNDESKSINITVIAPWWLSKLAIFLYFALVIVIMVFFRYFSLIGVKQKNQLLLERIEKEKIEELSKMKLRFFTNISHEFRTPLTLILGPAEKLINEKSTLSEEMKDKIPRMIYKNAQILLQLINQLLDFRKFEQGKMP